MSILEENRIESEGVRTLDETRERKIPEKKSNFFKQQKSHHFDKREENEIRFPLSIFSSSFSFTGL